MPTSMLFHEVDDVDPQGTNRVGLIVEVPDMDTFRRSLESDGAAEAMKHDGVRPDTIVLLVES